MDRDPGANQIDPVERETPSTGENDTGETGDEAARVMQYRRKKGTEAEGSNSSVQTKKTPRP
jgi:hypothetical protein